LPNIGSPLVFSIVINEDSGDVESNSYEDKSDALRITEEETTEVSVLDTFAVRFVEKAIKLREQVVYVLLPKADYSAIVHDDIRE